MNAILFPYRRVGVLLIGALTVHASSTYAEIADFDDLALPAESFWHGPAAGASDEPDPFGGPLPVKVGAFASGGVDFGNEHNLNYASWSGFAYSNVTNNTTPGFGNQYSAFAGSGNGAGDDTYGVAFGYNGIANPQSAAQVADLPYFELPNHGILQSAYVTNTTYAALAMRDGDTFSKQFGGTSGEDPDWFKLTAYGTDALGALLPAAVEFYLADYRFDDDTIVDTWTLVDLSSLAAAKRVYFNLSSSDSGEDGMNTPGFFAIDDIQFVLAPEPGSWLLLVLGMIGMVARFRRTR
ncbi:MAG: DUF4465 domain-containing protein [Pirellulales bacterium]